MKRQDGPAGALPLNVVFAGNLGRFQNLEVLIDAATILIDDAAVEFHIFGDGTRWFALERTIDERRLDSVHLYGHQQPEQVATFLRERADLAVVSLAPGVIGAAYPSKTLSYLRNGCPVLALVEADSELARTVQASGAGFHADRPTRWGWPKHFGNSRSAEDSWQMRVCVRAPCTRRTAIGIAS